MKEVKIHHASLLISYICEYNLGNYPWSKETLNIKIIVKASCGRKKIKRKHMYSRECSYMLPVNLYYGIVSVV